MNRVSPYTKQRMSFIRIALFGSLMLIAGSAAAQSHVTVGGHVFGGGKNASVGRGTTVLIDQAGAVVSGDVYGGGALAKVDTAISALNPDPVPAKAIDSTLVTILNGSIKGNVYGGGLGQADDPGEEGDQSIAADVYGGVHVYIGNSARGNATLGNTVGPNVTGGNVFGGNNVNGSPKKNVKVDIWKTAHTEANEVDHGNVFTTFDNFKANVSHAMTAFAIQAVYGGGNEANYVPTVSESCSTSVYIHNCDNTVKMVYGGGRAADVGEVVSEDNTIKADVHVTVDGGRIDTLFGGGDGHTKDALGNYRAADIYGNAISAINGGYFTAAFAGSNTAGDIIGGTKQLTVSKTGPCSSGDEYIISLFGGSNEAATHGNVELTVGCGVDNIYELYGGSNKAEIIDGNVTLNVYGGNYTNVFGGSKGDLASLGEGHVDKAANITGNVTLNLYGGIMSNAFGGSNQNGNIDGQITVNVLNHEVTDCGLSVINNIYGAGNVTQYHPTSLSEGVLSPVVNVIHVGSIGSIGGNIYGGANGSTATVTANPIVNFGYDATTMYELTGVDYPDGIDRDNYRAVATGNVYGGGAEAATVGNTAVLMYKSNSQARTVFGGGNEAGVSGATSITISDGTVTAGIYGGCNTSGIVTGDITVTMNGGAVGASGVGNEASVFGGGYGNSTATQGDVTVTIDGASAVVWGDVYGGSALGSVNNEGSDVTTVNILDGEVKGDVFGGGLGEAGVGYVTKGQVNGLVTVNIGQDNGDGTYSGNATIGGNVYGCNNTNGSPQQDVTVNIYATAHTAGVNEVGDAGYALANVFGGGKNADFTIAGKRARVNVHSCNNTINRVFGGGDAAAVTGTAVMIQGGRINNVFGGGNGETTAANVGTLGINLDMHGGRIGTLVSASNTSGTIGGPINVTVDNESGCDEVVTDFFGGSNMVDISTNVTTTIECGAGTFTNVYGGSNQANITGNVVLNVKGGTMQNVYGGSKGVLNGTAANITGNVTLNLYGGSISQDAFGGSNQNGAITGNITVNVLDHEGTCALDVNNIYGAGNVTPYTPTNPSATSPTINVMHIKQAAGIRGNVFGGGKGATAIVTAQPRVNIGYDASTMLELDNVEYPARIDRATEYVAKVTGSVYGGGDLASTNGSPIVKMEHPNSHVGNLFGGGNNVGISGNSTITINNGTVIDGVYGGCNVTGTVTGNSTITLLGGTVGSPSHNGNIFGGGLGQPTKVDGDVIITYGNTAGTATPTLYGNLYGGSALGAVNTKTANIDSHNMNTHETTTIDILSGSVNGNIFGGGLGQADDPEVDGDQSIAAIVHGKIQINVGSSTISDGDYTGNAVLQNATIYGCNNIKGTPQNDVYIDIYKTHRETSDEVGATSGATFAIGNVYGGGNRADYAPDYIYRREQAFINGIANDALRRPYVKKPHVYVHGCNNTISELYGGGNAAAVPGDSVVFDGGRYDLIFGGGNGTVVPANVGIGGVFLEGKGGFCGFIYEHCNRRGAIEGEVTFKNGSGNHEDCNEGVLKVHNHYCGGNEVDILGNFTYTFSCTTGENANSDYNALYGGCRLGTTYGNITLIIEGGHFGTIFGGPRGAEGFAANVKKFPASRDEMVNHPELYSAAMIEWMDKNGAGLYGTGGNVKIILRGGTIGDVFGGCDVNGNVEGRITIIVDSTGTCPLDIDNIFGGGNLASYSPDTANTSDPNYDPNYAYPLIDLQNGHVNHNVFGGGKGSLASVDNGKVTSNPKVHMHPDVANSKKFRVLGNIYGGGELGQVQGNTTVLIEKGTVKGSVYGAGLGNAADEDFGLVAKNTTVDMRDGLVEHNIYGGGEMASVGTFTRTDHAVTGCTANTGKATVTILAGTVGPTSMPADFLSGYNGSDFVNDRIVGMVFGGSKGVAGNPESNPLYDYIAFANETDVTIGENSGHTGPFIKGSVYGGSQNGHVYNGGTHVKIYGGQIGCGAGQTTVYADEAFIATPATVDDYNKLAECPHWVYGRNDGNGVEYLPYDPYATNSTADARPKGSDGHTYYGNVYGGGSGFYPFAERQWLRSAGQVYGSTKVEITGGHILTSVYGGNELTDVIGDSCVIIMTGGTIGVPRTLTQIGNHPVTCYLFGAGKGDERTHFNQWTNVQNTRVSVSGTARIYGSIFGGGEDGHVLRNTKVTLKDVVLGTTGTSYVDGNVFGGGRGFKGDALTAGNVGGDVLVDISGTSSTKVLGSVYGGGRLASVGYGLYAPDDPQYGVMRPDNQDDDGNSVPGFARGHIRINIHGSATIGNEISTDYSAEHSKGGNVFGSSMGRLTKLDGTYLLDLWQKLGTSKQTTVHIYENAKVRGNVYGGSELGSVAENTTVNIYGDAEIGHLTSGTHYHGDVYAGGYGISTKKSDLSTITEEGDLRNKVQQFSGRVYGSTEVNVYGNATLHGDVYGGGEMASVGTVNVDASGNTLVNIGEYNGGDYRGNATIIGGEVYGCNNIAGTPLGNAVVNIYSTHRETNEEVDYDGASPAFALVNVYGGGNEADYRPNGDPTTSTKHTSVHVYGCANTIEDLYGGGNAAYAYGVAATIDGGRFDRVFGGGNGEAEDTQADIGAGGTNTTINAGIIRQVFGGSNMRGTIYGPLFTTLTNSGSCTEDEHIDEFYAGSNEALIVGDITTTIECSTPAVSVSNIYGGCNLADIYGSTTLNIHGGTFTNVYGGSKGVIGVGEPGDLGYVEAVAADIKRYDADHYPTDHSELIGTGGTATLNIYGGTIVNAFGGSDANGNVEGAINVTVDQKGDCALNLDYVYGGGNLATNDVVDHTITSPYVHLLNGTVNHDVFGGGLGSTSNANAGKTTANAKVEMTPDVAGGKNFLVKDNIYGGGSLASVEGTTSVTVTGGTVGQSSYYMGEAPSANPDANANYSAVSDYYNDHAPANTELGHVFGGGKGNTAYPALCTVNGTNVTIGTVDGEASDLRIYGSVFGGAAKGHVTGNTAVTVHSGTVGTLGVSSWDGYVFGGGEGAGTGSGGTFAIYPTCGHVGGNTSVTIDGGRIKGSVYGGGRLALTGVDQTGDPSFREAVPNDTKYDSVSHGFATVSVGGNAVIGMGANDNEAITALASDYSVGDIFGSGRGDVDYYNSVLAGRVANTSVTVSGSPTVYGAVFGGGEMAGVGYWTDAAGHPFVPQTGTSHVNVSGGTFGTTYEYSTAYLAAPGDWTVVTDGKLTHACTGNIVGGSQGDVDKTKPHWISMGRSRQTFVNISGGTIMGNVYGGAEQGVVMENTKVTVSGGTIGTRITNPNYADSVTTCQDIHDAWVEAHNTWASSDAVAAHNTWKANHAEWVLKKLSHDAWAADNAAHDAWLARKSAHEAWETAYAAWLAGDRAALDQPVEPPLPGVEPTVDVEPVAPGDEPVDPGEPIEPEEPECSVQEYLYSFGSVFGGGYGREQTDAHDNDSSAVATLIAGRVYGNTTVIISGGQIYENVYGGGNMASVGYVEKDNGSYALNDTTKHHNGVCNVTITGTAIIGPHDHTLMNGHVYGGGKGVGNDLTEYFKEYCNVNRTNLIVSGGHIYGSTFGGGADCHVLGSTSTTIQDDAYIGSDEYIEEYDGCVIGGGRNALNRNHTAGRVAGNVHVTVTGGRIQRSVLGGGALARTGVDVDGGVDAFVNNSGAYDSVHHGRTVVNVSGTSEVVNADLMETTYSRFKGTTTTEGVADGYVRLHHTAIGAPDGPILVDNDYTIGDIFGGGKGDTKDTTDIMAGRVMNTHVFITGSPRIMADVYAGGEMSSVGWWDTNRYEEAWPANGVWPEGQPTPHTLHDKYYANTGYTELVIDGDPYTGTPYEFSSANIHYGRPWTLIDSLGRLYHTCSGNVYGGGQGYVEEHASHCNNWVHMGRVRNTSVRVEGGRFMGNVFGGGSRGVVKEDCSVTITGGTFGCIIKEDTVIYDTTYTYYDAENNVVAEGANNIASRKATSVTKTVHDREYAYGSAFGGGYGNHKVFWHYNDSSFVTTGGTRIRMQPMEQAGRVYGNTYLTISGGQFMGNVYGGGDMASTGYVERNASTGEFEFHTASKRHGGICNVTITGGEVGPLHDEEKQLNGHVYGGGKGIPYDPNDNFKKYCNVNETNLIVRGGHIHGSTFGGGADCHVLGNTNTTIHEGAYIGSGGDKKEYDGCVFGGGRNAENSNGTAGRVQGNAYITVDGGRIRRSILGGGALARTGVDVNGGVSALLRTTGEDGIPVYDTTDHGSTYINVSGSTYMRDAVLADGVDYEGHEVLIDGMSDEDKEKNKNFIYSLSASDKETYKDYLGTTEVRKVDGVYKIIVYKTAIGAYDGAVLVNNNYTIGDIFGGGKGDTKDTIDIMAGRVMNTHVFITGSPRIMADVYAGGEMSSVGWWDTNRFENNAWPTGTPNANHDKYYTNTGYTKLVIQGDPYTGTPYEFSSANIRGGRAWTLIDEINRLYHTCSGNIYGGGQGYVEQDATHYMNWVHMGRVRNTSVKVEGGRFMGNAFGGGSRGVVKEDCSVTITGGTFGTIIYDQPTGYNKTYYYYGSVFGGGYGNHKRFPHINDSSFVITTGEHTGDKVPMVPTEQAGRVYGNTTVNISGGHIMDCVYGGGDMASTGYVERDPATGDFMLGDASKRHGGICTVKITGTAIVGPLDYNGHNGYVYGAGRGIGSDANEYSKTFCNVNETRLTVALTEGGSADPAKGPDQWDVATMGGRIWGSLFGGGADCHVLGNVSTTVNSGVIGTDGTTSYDGNIFGGGRNYLHTNTTNGRVQGNIAVTVTRGTLRGTIFGGGRLAMAGIDVNGDFPTTGWTIADHGNVTIAVNTTDGAVSIGNPVTDSLLSTWESNGDIFGSGKGDTKIPYTMEDAGRVTNATINVSGSPRICGSVFGGGEMASLGYWNNTTYAFITGTGIATINISGSPTIGSINEINSYHKAADPDHPDTEAGENIGDWTIYDKDGNLIHTCTGNIYGGCQGDIDLSSPAWVHMGRSYSSNINITGTPTIMSNVSGGSEQGTVWGNTHVVINMSAGGTIGTTIDNASLPNNGKMFGGVYGGGYGADEAADTAATYTDALGSHDVTNNYKGHRTNWRADYIAGRVFGDTQVDILGGTINGSVYGGGERAYVGEDENGGSYGNTLVNIGNAGQRGDASKGATILGDVFGANNYMGTPYGNTEVHIYSTAHTVANTAPTAAYTKALTDPVAELTETDVEALPTTAESFAINAVYGGGNKAAHKPLASDGTTLVHIHYCEENSVRQVYGGGNGLGATKNASTKNNHIIIEGGRINVVFGGGNGASADGSSDKPYLDGSGNPTSTVTAVRNPGYNPGADVTGTAWTEIKGGLINDVFGGSNAKGVVSNTRLDIAPDGSCDMMVANTFGGGNEAFGGGGVITVGCGTKIGSFYGGSSNADLRGDIVLNVEGGTFENIFGGSRGTNERPANIDGSVTINVSGGNIQNIFGGSDINGNITGSITVNVDLDPDYNCVDGLLIGTIYGGGNLAIYRPNLLGEAPNQTLPYSPEINIINDSCANGKTFGLRTVFGGGYGNGSEHAGHSDTLTGYMKSNPVVNVGGIDLRWDKSEEPMGELVANEYRRNIASIRSNVYGGGEAAPVDGNPRVTLYSSRITSLDGSGNPVEATKNWDTTIVHGSVFGGGHGQTATVKGNTTVGVFGDATVVNGNVYGGGEAAITDGNTDVMVGYSVIAMPKVWIAEDGNVHIDCETPGVTIYYTTDGSVPNNRGNGTEYDGTPITPSAGENVRAIAYKYGYPPSLPTYPMHTFAPVISISEGTVTLSMPAGGHSDAKIYYTIDGTDPTSSSTLYNSTFAAPSSNVVKAIAVRPGYASSKVAKLTCATPVVEIDRSGTAKITCATAGATIRYTLGVDPADPVAWTTATTVANGGTVTVPSGQTIKVMADCGGYGPSEVAVNANSSAEVPNISVNADTRTVTITATRGTIHFTTDGSTPTSESATYSEPLENMAGKTIKAIAIVDENTSTVATLSPAATPTFNAVSYNNGDQVSLTSTSGATIYYTTDGTTPTTASTRYTGPFNALGGTHLKAYAVKNDMNVSAVTSVIDVPLCNLTAPTISVEGTSTTPNTVTITADAGATIYYTVDGTTPTAESNTYNSTITLNHGGTTTVKAIAIRAGCNNSDVTSRDVTITAVATPTFTTTATTRNVTISFDSEANLRYTNSPSVSPTATSARYTPQSPGVFTYNNPGSTLNVVAEKNGVLSEAVLITPVAKPTFEVDDATVTISGADGTTVYYSIDGGINYSSYSAAITLLTTTTVKAYAYKLGHNVSGIVQKYVEVGESCVVADPTYDQYNGLECATDGATIWWSYWNDNDYVQYDPSNWSAILSGMQASGELYFYATKEGCTPSQNVRHVEE